MVTSADRRDDGSYVIRRWRASDGALLPIDGHDESYDEEETYRRLNLLRQTGDTYVRQQPPTARLVQPLVSRCLARPAPVLRVCLLACRFGEESQQRVDMSGCVAPIRRCTSRRKTRAPAVLLPRRAFAEYEEHDE